MELNMDTLRCTISKLLSRAPIIVAVLALVLGGVNICEAGIKTIDKRTYTDKTGSRYYIVFVARGGTPTGHAYISWGMQNAQTAFSSQTAYGFYPDQFGIKAFFTFVSASLQNEAFNQNSQLFTERLIVEVNKEVYYDTQKAKDVWATNNYNLFAQNCVSFTKDVAKRTGLKLPSQVLNPWPSSYVEGIAKSN